MCDLERWGALCGSAGATREVVPSYHALMARYADPPRAYHNMDHVAHCLAEFDLLAEEAEHPAAVAFALWFHDAIYDTHRSDNEERSAEFARQTLLAMGVPALVADPVPGLILLTRHDQSPFSTDGKIIVDVDLAILGTPPPCFDDYEARIRKEYAWVDETLFWTKRREFLLSLLNRPWIFNTPRFRTRYEAAARQNIRRAIARAKERRAKA